MVGRGSYDAQNEQQGNRFHFNRGCIGPKDGRAVGPSANHPVFTRIVRPSDSKQTEPLLELARQGSGSASPSASPNHR